MADETSSARRGASDDEILLGLLGVVERDPAITQRSVASELGIALGLVNAYLKRCIRKGLIKVAQAPARRYTYYLTPHGFAEKSRLTASYLAHSFSFFRRARTECGVLFAAALAKGQKRFALVGTGDLAEIAAIVAKEYPIEKISVIAATSDPGTFAAVLREAGSVDAVIVTALDRPRDVFDAAVTTLGRNHVYAPPLLRIFQTAKPAARGERA